MSNESCERCYKRRYEIAVEADFAKAHLCPQCATTCSICKNERIVWRQDPKGYEIAHPCECQKLLQRIERFNATRIPARYVQCTLTTFEDLGGNQRDIHQRVQKHVDGFRPGNPGLLISGQVGTGKTHLLVAILTELALEGGFRTRFVEFTHLLGEIKEEFNLGKNEAEVLGPVSRIPVLGVDELGKGLLTEWQLSILDEIVSRRYNQGLTTYFTTNIPLDRELTDEKSGTDSLKRRRALEAVTLSERVGERIFSRLHQMCVFLTVKGSDARRGERKAEGW